MQLVSQFRTDKRGSVAVAFAITSIPVLMATGAAIDYSRATRERSAMHQALDQALLSAALVKPAERETTAVNTYRASTRQTARTDDTLSFRTDEAARVLHGTATAKVPMFLTKLGGFKSLEVGVTGAVSLNKNPVCMLLTAPDGVALKMGSSSLIKMPGCEIDVRSVAASASTSAADLNSSAVVDAQELCVAGQIKSSLSRSYYKSACKPIEDKWAAKMPKMMPDSSCLYNGKTYKNQNNLPAFSPGTICNGMTFSTSATVTFLPGVYRVRNGAIAFNAAS